MRGTSPSSLDELLFAATIFGEYQVTIETCPLFMCLTEQLLHETPEQGQQRSSVQTLSVLELLLQRRPRHHEHDEMTTVAASTDAAGAVEQEQEECRQMVDWKTG